MRLVLFAALYLTLSAPPAWAETPPSDKPLPGERLGGEAQDLRAAKRLDTRVPSRLGTRVTRRTIEAPLAAANSHVLADANNGCARDPNASATQTCQPQQ